MNYENNRKLTKLIRCYGIIEENKATYNKLVTSVVGLDDNVKKEIADEFWGEVYEHLTEMSDLGVEGSGFKTRYFIYMDAGITMTVDPIEVNNKCFGYEKKEKLLAFVIAYKELILPIEETWRKEWQKTKGKPHVTNAVGWHKTDGTGLIDDPNITYIMSSYMGFCNGSRHNNRRRSRGRKKTRKTSRRKTSRRKTSRRKTSRRKTSRRKTSRRKTSRRKRKPGPKKSRRRSPGRKKSKPNRRSR